jgi:hypothetical protein
MLAQSPSPLRSIASAEPKPVARGPQAKAIADGSREFDSSFSLKRITATLQVLLATRRAARNQEHAYWYTVARGL